MELIITGHESQTNNVQRAMEEPPFHEGHSIRAELKNDPVLHRLRKLGKRKEEGKQNIVLKPT